MFQIDNKNKYYNNVKHCHKFLYIFLERGTDLILFSVYKQNRPLNMSFFVTKKT